MKESLAKIKTSLQVTPVKKSKKLKLKIALKNKAIFCFNLYIAAAVLVVAVDFKNFAFFCFAGVVNFHFFYGVSKKIFFGKNIKGQIYVFGVVYMMRHVYEVVAHYLFTNKIILSKGGGKAFKGLVKNRGRKIF